MSAPVTREQEIRSALRKAKRILPSRDYAVLSELVDRAQWKTAEILPRWQPRSLAELARLCNLSKSTLVISLDHLELHKWIERQRAAIPGRGHATSYQVSVGAPCDCPGMARRSEPVTDAERMRRYRARRKVSDIHVTETSKGSDIHVTKGPTERNDAAGQPPFSAKEGRDEGEVVEGEQIEQFPEVVSRPAHHPDSGPCAKCHRPCIRYGIRGRPLCDPCASDALLLAELPQFPESWDQWPEGSNGEAFSRAVQVLADAGMIATAERGSAA